MQSEQSAVLIKHHLIIISVSMTHRPPGNFFMDLRPEKRHVYWEKNNSKGSLAIKKNGKKGEIVPHPHPPKRVKRGDLLFEKTRKLRQMRFCDNIAYVWGLGCHWDPLLLWTTNHRSCTLSHPTWKYADKYNILWSNYQCVWIVHFQVICGPGKFGLKKELGLIG